jgi:hypothetical protein
VVEDTLDSKVGVVTRPELINKLTHCGEPKNVKLELKRILKRICVLNGVKSQVKMHM